MCREREKVGEGPELVALPPNSMAFGSQLSAFGKGIMCETAESR